MSSGTVTLQGSLDKTNFVDLAAVDVKSGEGSNSIAAAGIYQCSVVGIKHLRLALASADASSSIDLIVVAVPLTPGQIPLQAGD